MKEREGKRISTIDRFSMTHREKEGGERGERGLICFDKLFHIHFVKRSRENGRNEFEIGRDKRVITVPRIE